MAVLSGGRFTLGLGAGENLNEHVVGAWLGWRGFDAATLWAAGDIHWPHRRLAEVSRYA